MRLLLELPFHMDRRGRDEGVDARAAGVAHRLAGAVDILGWQFRLGVLDIQVSTIGFIGFAVALLGLWYAGG